jgi:hypothetical protein
MALQPFALNLEVQAAAVLFILIRVIYLALREHLVKALLAVVVLRGRGLILAVEAVGQVRLVKLVLKQ